MDTVRSADGTTIAFDQFGQGPAIIIVDGALGQRAMEMGTGQIAPLLAQHFTVIYYDRRGRGDSTDTLPFAVDREIEDIDALVKHVGGSAFLAGFSSGACLAMEAAIKLGSKKIKKLAMYEAPYDSAPERRQAFKEYRKNLDKALAEGRKGDAAGLFMLFVGMPPEHLPGMRQHPMWPMFEAAAPTLAYDAAAMGEEGAVPVEHAARVPMPALVMDGGASYPFMHVTALALVKAMPNAQQRTLEGQTHDVAADAIAPVLADFFGSEVPAKSR